MNHIELIGVPGVGKSTLYLNLIQLDEIYPGSQIYCPMKSSYKLRQLFDKLFWPVLSSIYYTRFTRDYPHYKDSVLDCMNAVEKDKERMVGYLKDIASKYQYGVSNKKSGETLCLDEGFYHRSHSVGKRSGDLIGKINSYKTSPSSYYDSIPTPDILFHISADTKVIQQRRKKRDGELYPLKRLKKVQDLIRRVCIEARSRGVNVIKVMNNNSANESMKALEKHLR